MNDLAFRLETIGPTTYLVYDEGQHARPITQCLSRVASDAEVMLAERLALVEREYNAPRTPPEGWMPIPKTGLTPAEDFDRVVAAHPKTPKKGR